MNENKLIAEFMGVVFHDDENQYYDNNGLYIGEELRYHTSWDWLMPVVQKFSESNKYLDEQDEQDLMQTLLYGYIDDVYRLIVEFIKEYNEYE